MKKHRKTKLKLIAWFLLKFNLLAIPLYIAIYANFSFQPLQVVIAQITAMLLNSAGYDVAQGNQTITAAVGNALYNVDVSWDSTGWKSLYALFALVMATPVSKLNRKLKFLIIGLPAIFMLNLIRILTTIMVALGFGFQYFDIIHTLLWREGLIVAVVLLWYVWLIREKHNIRQK